MKTQYRAVLVTAKYYTVEEKPWWSPFWIRRDAGYFSEIEDARKHAHERSLIGSRTIYWGATP